MNKIIISIALILSLISMVTTAQDTDSPGTSLGFMAGVNFQNLNGKDYNGDNLENDMILGFHAGVNAQIPIASEFYFQPGIMFSTKGAQNKIGDFTVTENLNYVEVPLELVYKSLLGSGYVMLGFGPYLAYAISGKVTVEGSGAKEETDIKFTNTVEETDADDVPYLKAIDAGGNIFAGYEMSSGLFFRLNAQLGMLNINPTYNGLEDDKSSLKNTGFGLSIGYRL